MTWKGVTVKSVCEHKKWGAGPLTREKSDFSHRLSLKLTWRAGPSGRLVLPARLAYSPRHVARFRRAA